MGADLHGHDALFDGLLGRVAPRHDELGHVHLPRLPQPVAAVNRLHRTPLLDPPFCRKFSSIVQMIEVRQYDRTGVWQCMTGLRPDWTLFILTRT